MGNAKWVISWNQDCQKKYQQPQICGWCHLYDRKQRGSKEPLDKGERGDEIAGLKLNIQKTKIMASGPITSWQIDGEKIATMTDFIFLGSKITANSDCRHKIKRCLLLGRKAIDKPKQHTKKQRHLPTKVCIVKAMVFLVVMYRCESWTIKKAECQRTDAFEL